MVASEFLKLVLESAGPRGMSLQTAYDAMRNVHMTQVHDDLLAMVDEGGAEIVHTEGIAQARFVGKTKAGEL